MFYLVVSRYCADLCNLFIVAMLLHLSLSAIPFHFFPVLFFLSVARFYRFVYLPFTLFIYSAESVEFLLQFRFKATLILCADGHGKMCTVAIASRCFCARARVRVCVMWNFLCFSFSSCILLLLLLCFIRRQASKTKPIFIWCNRRMDVKTYRPSMDSSNMLQRFPTRARFVDHGEV